MEELNEDSIAHAQRVEQLSQIMGTTSVNVLYSLVKFGFLTQTQAREVLDDDKFLQEILDNTVEHLNSIGFEISIKEQ